MLTKLLHLLLCATMLAAGSNGSAIAADDSPRFIEALRQRGYFDTATQYIDALAADPTLSTTGKLALSYQQALVLIDSGSSARDPAMRDQQFDQAQERLKEF